MNEAEKIKAAGLDWAKPVNFIVLTDGQPSMNCPLLAWKIRKD